MAVKGPVGVLSLSPLCPMQTNVSFYEQFMLDCTTALPEHA